MSARRGLIAVAAAAAALAAAPAADADLGYVACVRDNAATGSACPDVAPGLKNVSFVAPSPDGRFLYTASISDFAVDAFTRDGTTGVPTFASCESSTLSFAEASCATRDGVAGGTTLALGAGADGYVYSGTQGSIAYLARSGTTGAVSPLGCVRDEFISGGSCASSAPGLNAPTDAVVSPDGESVYVTAAFSMALATFARDPATGAITSTGCFKDPFTPSFVSAPSCASTVGGLGGPLGLTVSPDGRSVYVATRDSSSVTIFNRSAAAGHPLTYGGCIADAGVTGSGCSATAGGLYRAGDVAVTPDNRTVIVGGDNGLSYFTRNTTTGALTPAGCIVGTAAAAGTTCAVAPTISGAFNFFTTLEVPADGRNVYLGRQVLLNFARDPATGILSYVGCVRGTYSVTGFSSASVPCSTTVDHLRYVSRMATSGDGRFLYATSPGTEPFDAQGALYTFTRGLDATPAPLAPSVPASKITTPSTADTVSLPVACSPGATEYCDGTLTLRFTPKTGRAAAKKPKPIVVGSARYRARTKRGRTTVGVKLGSAARRELRRSGSVKITASVVRNNPNGTRTTGTKILTVRRKR